MGRRCIFAILLALTVLAAPAAAAAPEGDTLAEDYGFADRTLEEILAQFRAEYGLDERNFSMAYYATGTGERYAYAEQVYRTAASIYKLPLNMAYYEKRAAGQLSGDSTVAGYRLDDMQEQSIVWSNNELSELMLYHVVDGVSANSFRAYREYMTRYCEQDYPAEYYADNKINVNYMMAVLHRLYDEPTDAYAPLLEDLQAAMPDAYFRRYVTEYPIAHKYGAIDSAINDVGIVYTPEPYLLAAMTEGAAYGEEVLARLCELMTAYTVWQTAAAEEEQEAVAAMAQAERIAADAALQAAEQQEAAPAAEPEADGTQLPAPELPWWWRFAAICIAVALAAAAAITVLMVQVRRAEE